MNTVYAIAEITKLAKEKGAVKIEGYANRAIVDRSKEYVAGETWNAAIKNYIKNPILLFNHDASMPVGKASAISVDNEGLKIIGYISRSDDPVTSRIRNLVEEGVLSAFSVGMRVGDMERKSDGTIELKDIDLLEVSVVPVGENQDSLFKVVKGAVQPHQHSEKLLKTLEAGLMRKKAGEAEKIAVEGETGVMLGHAHHVMLDNETMQGVADTIIGEYKPHTHVIQDGEVMPGGAEPHTHPLDLAMLKPGAGKPEAEQTTDMQAKAESMPTDGVAIAPETPDDQFGSPYLEEMQKQSQVLMELVALQKSSMEAMLKMLALMQEDAAEDIAEDDMDPAMDQQDSPMSNPAANMGADEQKSAQYLQRKQYLDKLEARLKQAGL